MKGLRPSEGEKQYSEMDWCKDISRGRLCFKNFVSKTNLNPKDSNQYYGDRSLSHLLS